MLGLCADLVKADWKTSIVTAPNSYGLTAAAEMSMPAYGVDLFQSPLSPRTPRQLRETVAAASPDLIHVHGPRAAYPFCLPPLRRLGPKLVYSVQGYHFAKRALPRRLAGWLAERAIASRVNHMIFVSQSDRAIARDWSIIPAHRGSHTIYNSIDPSELDGLPAPARKHDLVFVARMHLQKNPSFMVDIMVELRETASTLLMAGGGELEPAVREYAERRGVADKITFTGSLARPDALAALASGRVFVLPSRWEGLPFTPIEAMHLGLPVVASDIGGTNEVVANGVTGILVRDFNAADYAAAIRKLLSDQNLYDNYSRAARLRVQDLFQRSTCSMKHIEVYRELLARPN